MRVIAGTLRGLKLAAPDGFTTRPTLDRVKEAVFSMLTPYLRDSVVLDLFAGSGALGIEALSRGASEAFFIDSDKAAVACIKSNIRTCRVEERANVVVSDALKFVSETEHKFDIIFLDPPYFADVYSSVIEQISNSNILSSDGIIVVEWDYECKFTNSCPGFSTVKEKKYGRVGITTLKRVINQ